MLVAESRMVMGKAHVFHVGSLSCDYYSADRNEGASANCRDIFLSERTDAAVLPPTLFYVNPQERKPQAQRDWLDLL